MELHTLVTNLFVPGVSIAEKIIRPLAVYVFLVIILRIAGQRSLGQLNSFDLVVLLTLSNTVQNAIIGSDNSLIGGIIGATTLVLVNVAVVHYLYHHRDLDRKVEGEPIVLVDKGRAIPENLHKALLTRPELDAAVRRQSVASLEECERVILETSGAITVIPRRPTPPEQFSAAVDARLDRIERLLADLAGHPPTGQRAND